MLKALFVCTKSKFLLIITYLPGTEFLVKWKATHHNYVLLFVIFFILSDSLKKKKKVLEFCLPISEPSTNYLTETKLSISCPEEALEINQKLGFLWFRGRGGGGDLFIYYFFMIGNDNFFWNQRILTEMGFLCFCEILHIFFHFIHSSSFSNATVE